MARDEAYLSFVDAKKRANEIAKSRGFYPIVALAPENNYQRESKPARGPRRGKGRGKEKSKGKGRSGSPPARFLRPGVFGPRAAPPPSAGSTSSGSAQQHGPRFKRFRGGGFAGHEKEDEARMVEDILEHAN